MLSITDGGAPARALDPALRAIIDERREQLRRNYTGPLDAIVAFHVVEPGDTEADVAAALGFNPLENVVDGTRLGDPDFTYNSEWAACHGRWIELLFLLDDAGFGTVLFIKDDPETDFDLHMLAIGSARG